MKRQLMILFITLIPLIGFSQTITSKSIQNESGKIDTTRVVALIFAEHDKLSKENPLLKQKINLLEELNKQCEVSDSLHIEEINLFKEKVAQDNKKIKKLKSSLKVSYVGGIVLFLLGLIL